MERRLVELESCLEVQILRNNALDERLCKLENHERTTGIKMSNLQDPGLNPSMDCPKPAPPTEVYECINPPVGCVSQESGKPPQIPNRSVQSRCDEDKPPKMIASNSTMARSGTSICREPIPHSEETEKGSMFSSFIDLKKAYDLVDRSVYGTSLEVWVLEVRCLIKFKQFTQI